MFREMRRKDKMNTYEEAVQILGECTNGVLSVTGDDGYPYGVPVSYIYTSTVREKAISLMPSRLILEYLLQW